MESILVKHLYEKNFEDFSQKEVEYCKLLVLDSLGVCIPGSKAPGCPEVIELLGSWSCANSNTKDQAPFFLFKKQFSPPQAALMNSMIMHALDFDDTLDDSALHCFVNVLPAALAVADGNRVISGKRLIEALILGTDLICRISKAIPRPLSWIRTATCGSFGAAAAAGKALGLNKEELHNALGIVYSQTGGNAQGLIEGRLVKRMQPGFAAQAGVLSAFLVKAGITGSRSFLEGKYGYFNLYENSEYERENVLSNLKQGFQITELSIKPYPCCRMTHSSIDAALMLREELANSLDKIVKIEVYVSKMVKDMVGGRFFLGDNPQVNAQFSIAYTVAAALHRGDVFLDSFTDQAILDRRVLELAKKVEVIEEPGLSPKDIFFVRIEVLLNSGQLQKQEILIPWGNPKKPLNMEEVREKFKKCVAFSGFEFRERDMEKLFEYIENLEELADVSMIVQELGKIS